MNKRERIFVVIFFLFLLSLGLMLLYSSAQKDDRVEIPSSGSIKTASLEDQLEIAEQIYAYLRARGWYIYIDPYAEGWGIREPDIGAMN